MNAVERLEAAIEKLEADKAKGTPGPWFLTYKATTHPRVWGNASDDGEDADAVAQAHREGNAELIVTLHRTIDAQLAILRGARSDINVYGGRPVTLPAAIYLADAILGGAS